MNINNRRGSILLELLVSLIIISMMISYFTIELINMNKRFDDQRLQYKMQTILVQHVLVYEQTGIIDSSISNELDARPYVITIIEHELCIEWEDDLNETKRMCQTVNEE